MLEVSFYRDESHRVAGISARGHVDLAPHGKDVVCAAVSAILQAARLGLTEYCRSGIAAQQEPGRFELSLPALQRDDPSVRAIVATAELAIERIAAQYPKEVRLHRDAAPVREAGTAGGYS